VAQHSCSRSPQAGPLGEAAEAALADDPNFDLTGNLAGLNRLGPCAGYRCSGAEEVLTAMTNVFPVAARSGSVLARIIHRVIAALGRIPDWFIALAARFFPAAVFWQSGETKVAVWHLKPSAISLFENEYQLPLIDPTIAAYVSAFSEHFFPILLVIGLATRFSALALLCMTVVIEIFVYPRRLANPWSVGHLFACRDRAGPGLAIARSFDRA